MAEKSKKNEILLETGTNELEVLEFTIGDSHFGINVAKVVEILQFQEVTPMPNANSCVEGVFKPREIIMTVINLASYMGLEPSSDIERDIFIITRFNDTQTAFHVHAVEGIHRISWTEIEKPDASIYGEEEGLATGIARFDGRLITILDFEKILTEISPQTGIQVSSVKGLSRKSRINKPILIAEDSALLSKLIKECLTEAGYTNVAMATNGKEAWEALQAYKRTGSPIINNVRCIITDLEMPQMDGHRLLKLIRDDEVLRTLPVIIFSSLISEEMKLKGDKLGATAQITKPEIAKLVEVIDKYIL